MTISSTQPAPAHPVADGVATLLYDGDCDICTRWVGWFQARCGERLRCLPYQTGLAEYPELSEAACRRAIQWIGPDRRVHAGAAAAFKALASSGGRPVWWLLYRWAPGFRQATEAVYRFTATHRGALRWITRLCWGAQPLPPRYERVCELFWRLLGGVYVLAFASFALQWPGLIGSGGILPIAEHLDWLRERLGAGAAWHAPTLLWFNASDTALGALCWSGAVVGVWLALAPGGGPVWGVARRVALLAGFVLYLSLFYGGQVFMAYQWDLLLLECGFLAIFLTAGNELTIWLFRWLLFRFMWLSGAVKLLSGDPSWAGGTALQYHYETQPLPTPLAWHAHQLPGWIQQGSVAGTFLIELALPALIFLPRRPRLCAAGGFALLEILIMLTGNYNFFNWLTLFLCVFLLDDSMLRRLWPSAQAPRPLGGFALGRWGARGRGPTLAALATLHIGVGSTHLLEALAGRPLAGVQALVGGLAPYRLVNRYGLFAVMTTTRPEIILQGSNDGERWHSYAFRHKPGALDRGPSWVAPHQPRLDWQMWFAALAPRARNPWFDRFAVRLLEGAPAVTALLAHNPFEDAPPRYLRALRYRYHFTDAAGRAQSGQWWWREPLDSYLPPASLQR